MSKQWWWPHAGISLSRMLLCVGILDFADSNMRYFNHPLTKGCLLVYGLLALLLAFMHRRHKAAAWTAALSTLLFFACLLADVLWGQGNLFNALWLRIYFPLYAAGHLAINAWYVRRRRQKLPLPLSSTARAGQ
ncbi:MAG: hypothetical protein FWF49_03785 [Oscillospiraceae bacterium]|nr:hypothetical protein [Oscillospiraceae bacterium]